MNKQVKLTLYGILLGIIGNILGFLIYTLLFAHMNNVDLSLFFHTFFSKMENIRSQAITASLLVNVVLFYVFMRKGFDALNRGLIIVILLTVMAIIYLNA